MTSPITLFQTRQEQFSQQEQAAQQRYNRLAVARLVWFVSIVVAVWVIGRMSGPLWAIIAGIIGVGVFLRLLVWHQAIRRQRDLARHLAAINADESGRLDRRYGRPETGAEFTDPAHPYTGDLDVFGPASLFRLLNRAHTHGGQHRLADWLSHPAPPDEILARQAAITELTGTRTSRPSEAPPALGQLAWRQEFEATARLNEGVGQPGDALLTWASEPSPALPGWLNGIRFVLPLVTVGLIAAWMTGFVSGWVVWGSLLVHGAVLSRIARAAQTISEQTYATVRALDAYRDLFRYAESLSVQTPWIRQVQQRLGSAGVAASVAIGHLRRLTEGLNYRRNPYFYLLFGVLSLWDTHYLLTLNEWRQRHGGQLKPWLDALADLEALNSLAGFAFAHPDYATPTLRNGGNYMEVRQAAHPLIPPQKAVPNSLTLGGSGETVLITGSNMSGKSTFLRTLGANVVLALAGSVVSAEGFALRPVRVFTSMRTQDSLEESTSSFYAELKRLQTLIQLTAGSQSDDSAGGWPVLYFLDEILKGTNSADRHRGAEALIHQLHRTPAVGFVSTHDLELGRLADITDYVSNYHFQSDMTNGELVFDYRLRDGICQSFNASQLMRAIGIEV